MATQESIQEVSQTEEDVQPHWASKPSGSCFRITVARAHGRQTISRAGAQRRVFLKVPRLRTTAVETPCWKKVVVVRASHDHSGVTMSLQVLSVERGSVQSKAHQKSRRHILEVE